MMALLTVAHALSNLMARYITDNTVITAGQATTGVERVSCVHGCILRVDLGFHCHSFCTSYHLMMIMCVAVDVLLVDCDDVWWIDCGVML